MTDTTLIEEMRKAKVRLKGISLGSEMDICVVEHSTVLIDLAIEALEQSQWVSVSEEQPPKGMCLVFNEEYGSGNMHRAISDGDDYIAECETINAKRLYKVTHWKLITPPTQESDTGVKK